MINLNGIFTSNNKLSKLKYPSGFKIFRGKIVPQTQTPIELSQQEYLAFINNLLELRKDINEDRLKALLLDEKAYLAYYQDVKDANLDPVYHYYSYGYQENRLFFEPNFRAQTPTSKAHSGKTIIFFDTVKSNASFLYRGFFPEIRNPETVIIHQETTVQDALTAIFSAKEMIFIRPSNGSPRTNYFMSLCKILNIKIIIDVDDLLLPDFAEFTGAVRSGVTEYEQSKKELTRDSAILLGAEKVVCSTPKIASLLSPLVNEVVVSKNKLPTEYFLSRETIEQRGKIKKLKFLYLSGSKTHLKDYSIISGALLKLAQNYASLFSITFLGKVSDQTAIFANLGVECNFVSMLNFEDMLNEVSNNNIVLIPLENNIFNNSKSNIKFIEAASQGVPVIASNVDEYVSCIQNNVNGWICKDDHEWYEILQKLTLNNESIRDVALNAYDSALAGYSL